MKAKANYSLYLVTDRELMSSPSLEESVCLALAGGVTVIQAREKTLPARAFLAQVLRLKTLARPHGVPIIVNDRVDVAMAAKADGVHIGQKDLPPAAVRRMIGPDMLLGVSAATVEEAVKAQSDGADYLGVGAMFPTGTKTDTRPTSIETLKAITAAVSIPVVAIGGVSLETAPQLRGTGIAGLAVVSAIVAQPDVAEAARQLRAVADDMLQEA